ncbi:hypothetical protein OQA88_2560 [Cercophora sp. LCS_1]
MDKILGAAHGKAEVLHQGLVIPHVLELSSTELERKVSSLRPKKSDSKSLVESLIPMNKQRKYRLSTSKVTVSHVAKKQAGKAARLKKYDLIALCDLAVDCNQSWKCEAKACQDGETEEPWFSTKIACSSCGLTTCIACDAAHSNIAYIDCVTRHNTPTAPRFRVSPTEWVLAAKRPLVLCSSCDHIQPQAGAFAVCDGCMAVGDRAVFCQICIIHGRDKAHMEKCKDRESGTTMRRVLVLPGAGECSGHSMSTCVVCSITYDNAVPSFASIFDEKQVCYLCFFAAGNKLATSVCEDNYFWLRLVDLPDGLEFPDRAVVQPILCLPDDAYQPAKESLRSKGIDWAKQQGAKQVAKRSINETIHWLTKSHVGQHGAAQLGLMGMTLAPAGVLVLPGMNYPPMKTCDFPAEGFNLSGTDVPSYDLPSSYFGEQTFGSAVELPLYEASLATDPGFVPMPGVDTGGCGFNTADLNAFDQFDSGAMADGMTYPGSS